MSEEKEIWKDITGYEGLYQVSNMGRFKSLNRTAKHSTKSLQNIKGRLLKGSTDRNGYQSITLCVNGKPKKMSKHRLVAKMFIPNPKAMKEVNHKNGIKSDNRAENLEWCSRSYNLKHSYENLGRKSPTRKLNRKQVLFILNSDLQQKKLAEAFNVSKQSISKLKRGKTYLDFQ